MTYDRTYNTIELTIRLTIELTMQWIYMIYMLGPRADQAHHIRVWGNPHFPTLRDTQFPTMKLTVDSDKWIVPKLAIDNEIFDC